MFNHVPNGDRYTDTETQTPKFMNFNALRALRPNERKKKEKYYVRMESVWRALKLCAEEHFSTLDGCRLSRFHVINIIQNQISIIFEPSVFYESEKKRKKKQKKRLLCLVLVRSRKSIFFFIVCLFLAFISCVHITRACVRWTWWRSKNDNKMCRSLATEFNFFSFRGGSLFHSAALTRSRTHMSLASLSLLPRIPHRRRHQIMRLVLMENSLSRSEPNEWNSRIKRWLEHLNGYTGARWLIKLKPFIKTIILRTRNNFAENL